MMILVKNGLSGENLDDESTATCLKPENFGKVVNCTLYHFSDACES